ncbi:hypothetical protein PSECIP111951_00089 [Pseudoalteromonas holothuriae]|uniref:GNAT family N-acetyltransferase n=1 Tax=Pseudoalteromonas holothuriae TaxID=2963714 RepID=A0ABM9GDW8_9GAMM|nr:hypothetical protein [Pseudoalteromonas sp. CIP111951]CAH9049967.1 hypothetical protein PSECIP111951_00089 [Pseudoalteromonas sp. CIP111951]
MHLKTTDLTQTKQWLNDAQKQQVGGVIQASFANVNVKDYLAKYFDCTKPHQRKLRLYYDNDKLVGYCLLTFSDEINITVIRASAAFLPKFRQGGNTFAFSLSQSIKAWLTRPWRKHYYADTMLSPAMYRAIAKKTGVIWPHLTHQAPSQLFERFNSGGLLSQFNSLRCLVEVNRASKYLQQDLIAFKASEKLEIQYYCQVNPDFDKGIALFVIIPVNLAQIAKTLYKNLSRK